MGHSGISGIIEASSEQQLEKKIRELKDQAAYQYGHDGYSGTINVLDAPHNSYYMPYTEYMFHKDLNTNISEQDLKDAWKDEKPKFRKLLALKKKHDFEKEITLDTIAKYQTGKKIMKWKKFVIDYFWHAESDILYVIQMSKRKYLWFGWARC